MEHIYNPFCTNYTHKNKEMAISSWTAIGLYFPFYIGFYRWAVFIILRVIPSLFYRQIKPQKRETAEPGEYIYSKKDVTCIIPVYEPPPSFMKTIEHLVMNEPAHIIVVADVTCEKHIREMCAAYPTVEVIPESKPGKRPALITGLKATKTRLIAFVDDDVQWVDGFIDNLVAPFQYAVIGGVGVKQVARVGGPFEIIQILADMRLAVRYLELRASTALDKGCSCISGRTGCYRTDLLQNEEFYDYFLNEKLFGMQLQSGDDKCVTRYMYKTGHKTYHQFYNNCKLSTSFETGMKFMKQNLRWSRNTWRSDIKALFIEKDIWRVCPFTAFMMFDKMLTPFLMMFGVIYVPVVAGMRGDWVMLIGWFIWLFVSRSIKLCYYLWEHPLHIVYIPFFVAFQYVQAFVRAYTLFTLTNRTWGTRSITVKNNVVVRKTKEVVPEVPTSEGTSEGDVAIVIEQPTQSHDIDTYE
jgi:cellulose synthase/poly-beta-1,6-N-acetylglucosamine synthase-like glycosyltransferase